MNVIFWTGEEEGISQGSLLLPSYKVNICKKEDGVNKKFAFKVLLKFGLVLQWYVWLCDMKILKVQN